MAMEVHSTPKHDMDCFIKECAYLFHDRWLRGHLFLSFCIQFFMQCPIIIRSHNLHARNIKRVMGEIISYHERLVFSLFLGLMGLCIFWPFFGLPLLCPLRWFRPLIFYWIFVSFARTWVFPSILYFFPLCWVLCFIHGWQVSLAEFVTDSIYVWNQNQDNSTLVFQNWNQRFFINVKN